jgi:hypothetical protein
MKKIALLQVFGLALAISIVSCKKSDDSNGTNTHGGNIAANSFKMDDTVTVSTPTPTSVFGTYMSAIFSVSFPGGSATDRVGVFMKQKPTTSGTYKVHHVYPADKLASNEILIDVNFGGCNYVTSDTSQTVTVTVSGSNINVQFTNLTYTFNNYIVLGNPTPRPGGKITGNLNFN